MIFALWIMYVSHVIYIKFDNNLHLTSFWFTPLTQLYIYEMKSIIFLNKWHNKIFRPKIKFNFKLEPKGKKK